MDSSLEGLDATATDFHIYRRNYTNGDSHITSWILGDSLTREQKYGAGGRKEKRWIHKLEHKETKKP